MVAIAAGEKVIRGVNPIAAANFVKDIVDELQPPEPEPDNQDINIHMWMPQTYDFQYRDAAPVIEGKVRELPDEKREKAP
jgi:hypothetical protein